MSLYIQATAADQITLNLMKADIHPILPIISGSLAYYYLNQAVRDKGIAVANTTWNIHSTIFSVLTGYLLWNENLTSRKISGIGQKPSY